MIYIPKKLESTFTEVTFPKKTILIAGCIYRHPCTNICIFNNHYLNLSLDTLSKEANKIKLLFC